MERVGVGSKKDWCGDRLHRMPIELAAGSVDTLQAG
jgi:hypothetical protein